MLLRRVARPLLAASLVSTGASTLLDPDPAVAEAAERDELPPVLDYLERAIPESGYLVEDRFTLADLAVAAALVSAAAEPDLVAALDRVVTELMPPGGHDDDMAALLYRHTGRGGQP